MVSLRRPSILQTALLSILAIALLALSLSAGYLAFWIDRGNTSLWDALCIGATLAFLGVLVQLAARRVEKMIEDAGDEHGAGPDESSTPVTAGRTRMSADSSARHRRFVARAETRAEERD